MAEIDIERRGGKSWWPWALAVLLLLVVVGVAWYFAGPQSDRMAPDTEGVEVPQPAPGLGGQGSPGAGSETPIRP